MNCAELLQLFLGDMLVTGCHWRGLQTRKQESNKWVQSDVKRIGRWGLLIPLA